MDPDDERLLNVNLASQSTPFSQETKPFLQSSMILLHRSLASHNDQHSLRRKPRALSLWHLLLPVISLLWLVPIAILFAFNYANYIIGVSVWCPRGRCYFDWWYDPAFAFETAKQLNRADHNTLGALQLVAKALETWFIVIATSIVFDLSMILAKKGKGLPVGYFLTHLRFTNICYLLNPCLWTCSIFNPNIDQFQHSKRLEKSKFCAFTILVVFLTILMNLMGPAMAVLVLPTLQYINTQHYSEEIFKGHGAASPPGLSGPSKFPGCDADDFHAFNYSCTLATYGPSLDNWATSAEVWIKQRFPDARQESFDSFEVSFSGTSQERLVQISINASTLNQRLWVPNRGALTSLSNRLEEPLIYNDSDQIIKDRTLLSNSLQLVYNQEGLAFALQTGCAIRYVRTIELSKDKDVICLFGDDGNDPKNNTIWGCFPRGTGWAIRNRQSQFFVQAERSANFGDFGQSAVAVNNYFFQKFLDSWNLSYDGCDPLGPSPKSCDWEKMFARVNPINLAVTEYGLSGGWRYWCDNIVDLGFATYSVDASQVTNPTRLVTMRSNPVSDSEAILIDPNWLLAAWSVGPNATVDGSRPSARLLARSTRLLARQALSTTSETPASDEPLSDDEAVEVFTLMHLFHIYSTSQALSMINYYNSNHSSDVSPSTIDDAHPVFHSWATRQVWAYGFSSRTATLGAVVGYAGAFCVLFRVALSVCGGTHRYDMSDLLVAALEYFPRSEFRDHDTPKSRYQVRFRLREDDDGRISFTSGQGRNDNDNDSACEKAL